MSTSFNIARTPNDEERARRLALAKMLRETPIPDEELLLNLPVYTIRQTLSHQLFMNQIYQQILDVAGVVFEFGVRWGRNLSTLHALRGIYEPFNHTRKLVGFDTFAGFPSVHERDGAESVASKGGYSVTARYQEHLEAILEHHEANSPIAHLKKFELVAGDVNHTLEEYLRVHPETIVALAYFDLDIYEPTKRCLELLRGHLTRGSVLAFDELNCPSFPGETLALKEVLGLGAYRIRRTPFSPWGSYLVVE
jgi:hypothetical protein